MAASKAAPRYHNPVDRLRAIKHRESGTSNCSVRTQCSARSLCASPEMNPCWVSQHHQNSSCSRDRAQGWLQHLLKSIQRCCRIGIRVGDVDGLHGINTKLNLSTGFVQGFFFFYYCFQNHAVCTQQISHLGNHPRWEWGKRYSVEENCNDNFFFFIYPTNRSSCFYRLAGFFAVTVYWKILGSLFYLSALVPC